MSHCDRCCGHGLLVIRYHEEDGYDVAACSCRAGQWWRQKGLLRAWADAQSPSPVQIGRLEEFFTAPELSVAQSALQSRRG